MTKRPYRAQCHCGAIRFSFRAEPFTKACRCNCSICIRKGAVMSAQYIPAEDFEPHRDLSQLSDYRWGDRDVNHLFCKTCGIYPYHGGPERGYRVNLGCVDDVDPLELDIEIINGRAL